METKNSSIEPRSNRLLIACWLQYGVFCIWAILAPWVIGQFKIVFDSFAGALSPVTVFFIQARYGWWLFAALSLILVLLISRRKRHPVRYQERLRFAWIALTAVAVLTFVLGVVALYLPIFKLGSVA